MSAFSQHQRISRRRVLAGTLATTAAAGLASVTACSGTGDSSDVPPKDARQVELPDYLPYEGVKPDFPAVNEYGLPGYLKFPIPAVKAVAEAPLSGGTVTASVALQAAVPAQMDRNAWWRNINSMLGGTLKLDAVPAADYGARLSTLLAGNDLPDLVQITSGLPNMANALAARFTELSQYLGGNKIAEYTQLAAIPEPAWKAATFKGGIYGIPMVLGSVSSRWVAREDIVSGLGLSSDVGSADELLALCKSVTDTKKNRWALGNVSSVSSYIAEMFEVPNVWRVTDGKLTRDIETEEYVEAIAFLKKLWEAGVVHPDAFASLNVVDQYKAGRIIFMSSGGNGMVSTYNLYKDADPKLEMSMMIPPKADGSGQAGKILGSGIYTLTSIPKSASPDRVRELLRVLNKLAGGFGTEEYLAVAFGAEGENYVLDTSTGVPKPTQKALTEKIPVNYLPGSRPQYFSGGYPEIVKTAIEFEKKTFEVDPVVSPTVGLYSASESNVKARLDKAITDAVSSIVQNRRPLDSWKDAVAQWRRDGGDKIRGEFEQGLADQ